MADKEVVEESVEYVVVDFSATEALHHVMEGTATAEFENWDSSAPTLVVRTVPEASEAEEAEEAEESLSADAADQGAASNDVQPTTIGFPGQWRDAVGSVAILDASRDEGSFDDGHGSTTNPVNRVVGFADKVLAFRPEVHTGVVAAPGTDQE